MIRINVLKKVIILFGLGLMVSSCVVKDPQNANVSKKIINNIDDSLANNRALSNKSGKKNRL